MFFTIASGARQLPQGSRNCAYLFTDGWNDWFKFQTLFFLIVADSAGQHHTIGDVKIGRVGLLPSDVIAPGQRAPDPPRTFDRLDESFFSLGQGEDYYLALDALGPQMRDLVLMGLRDCAFDLQIFQQNLHEQVMQDSLLRSVAASTVRTRLHRLTRGDAQLSEFHFRYQFPPVAGLPGPILDFDVFPESQPPSNVHVLIGRNGVGKTRCMSMMVEALLQRPEAGSAHGSIELISTDPLEDTWAFSGLVFISFSAFDDLNLTPLEGDSIEFQRVGLRHDLNTTPGTVGGIKAPADLATDFRKSLARCSDGPKVDRWRAAVRALETDALFAEANFSLILDGPFDDQWEPRVEGLFKRLSSGHAIVLLTVTRLVELVDEKTLVLLDEPEGHLHPPLLSAFIRCLSDLLVKRNGVAIIATHSPVVLQEVPKECAWKLRRAGQTSVAERPTVETFGENIGLLTREVFGLEVTRSGFHELIERAVGEGLSYDQVVARFDGKLGLEARAIARALITERDGL